MECARARWGGRSVSCRGIFFGRSFSEVYGESWSRIIVSTVSNRYVSLTDAHVDRFTFLSSVLFFFLSLLLLLLPAPAPPPLPFFQSKLLLASRPRMIAAHPRNPTCINIRWLTAVISSAGSVTKTLAPKHRNTDSTTGPGFSSPFLFSFFLLIAVVTLVVTWAHRECGLS